MKKYSILTLAIICMSALSGCSKDAADNHSNSLSQSDISDSDISDTEEATTWGQDAMEHEKERDSEDIPDIPEAPLSTESDAETVEYSYQNVYLSITIPGGWDYKLRTAEDLAKEDGLTLCAIDFWPEEYPDTVFELGYEAFFGICGTGVTIEDFTLSNGLDGYRYTEIIEDTLWLTMTLNNPDNNLTGGGTYCISAAPELSIWDAVAPEFEEIVDSIWVGPFPEAADTTPTEE